MRQIWGGEPVVASLELTAAVGDLQADLQAILQDLRRGPVAAMRDQIAAYLSELRREFLRPHRRLQVQMRTLEGRHDAQDALRRELVELAGRFRTVVLSRSSRVQHEGWTPERLSEAVRTAVEAMPRSVMAPYEPQTLESQPGDGPWRRWRRWLARTDRWLRKFVREDVPERQVELRELARYHLQGKAARQLEGLGALFLQCEVQLAGRSRQLLEAIAQGFEGLVFHVEQDDFPDMLAGLRIHLDDEFGSVERDVNKILDDSVRRAEMIYGDALRALKDDLPIVATFDLPARRRRSAPVIADAERALADLSGRLERLREHVSASYVLLALHLEFLGFRARLQHVMDDVLSELKADVRGRSWVQLERVRASVDEALEGLAALEASDAAIDDASVRARVQPLEHVVAEAAGVTRQLLDQLSAETSVAPLLEALNREAQGLTDRYRVPVGQIPRSEWRLPPPGALTEIDFSEVVTSFVQGEVAPELLASTHRAMNRVDPILDVFHDLERVVSFNAETIDDRIEASTGAAPAGQQLAGIMQATLRRSRDALTERLHEIAHWDESLVNDIREVVIAKIDELRRRLGEGEIRRAKVARRPDTAAQWVGLVEQARGRWKRFRAGAAARMRSIVGDARLAAFRDLVGLQRPRPSVVTDGSGWVARLGNPELPVFYSRLFAAQARWAGDVLNVPESEVQRARDALSTTSASPKLVALIGADSASRGALAAAVLRGGKPARRLAFTQPTSVDQVKSALAELGAASLIQLSGLAWLVSARPGGFAPLRYLLEVVTKEERRSAWLLEVDELVWDFAAAASPIDDVFATQIRVPKLTAEDLEQAIMARHQLSGYELRFEFQDGDETGRRERGPPRERYFSSLFAASGGLLQCALPVWLGSIARVVDEESVVIVGQRPRAPLAAMQRLSDETWTQLFVVARQGWVDPGTFAFVLELERAAAEGRLSGLVGLGLLERPTRDVFLIRRHLQGAVIAGLTQRGWLE